MKGLLAMRKVYQTVSLSVNGPCRMRDASDLLCARQRRCFHSPKERRDVPSRRIGSLRVADCVDELFGGYEPALHAAGDDAADERALDVGDAHPVLAVAQDAHEVASRDAVLLLLARNEEVGDEHRRGDEDYPARDQKRKDGLSCDTSQD